MEMKRTTSISLMLAAVSAAMLTLPSSAEAQQESYEIPACNVGDNRTGNDQCTQEDAAIGAVIFKIATEDVPKEQQPEMGFFVCTCGAANLQIVDKPLSVQGMFDPAKQSAVFIPAINPLCPVIIGGMQVLVTCTVD
jgi:hypothetical protein